ncbi:hypothetical protein NQ176_g9814 [Zarea fungicola]|uniref:Uncharacterized protein n=1 Tax=Zarea fungicola TaxID=93591 RepID=A0ACC1MLB9_9HYPO|nr:hypothetical protein NQ176_g9814 [Lecanicillium fungicola]
MKSLGIFFAALGVVYAAAQSKVSYDGVKVFRVPVEDDASVAEIEDIIASLQLDVWKPPQKAGAFADVVVPPSKLAEFENRVAGKDVIVMHEDLGASIEEESAPSSFNEKRADISWFNSYHSYQDHLTWLRSLQASYPANSAIVSSGTSTQGNTITGIHFYGNGGKGKPAVIFHGTVHAREWISTMVNEYLAYALLTGYGSDAEIKGFLDKYDFYIFPVVNPDGFIYTQTSERLWRKNRQRIASSNCIGTDVNRNWPYKWTGAGSSTNPCSDTYRGEAQASASETKGLSQFINNVKSSQGLKLYIDWHSYSQLFMSPYGWSCTALPPKHAEFQSLLQGTTAAITAVHGTRFRYGPICNTIYQVAGSSVDYVNDVVAGDYTFTAELRDTGNSGFVLPPSQILPSGEETFAGVRYLLRNMR